MISPGAGSRDDVTEQLRGPICLRPSNYEYRIFIDSSDVFYLFFFCKVIYLLILRERGGKAERTRDRSPSGLYAGFELMNRDS